MEEITKPFQRPQPGPGTLLMVSGTVAVDDLERHRQDCGPGDLPVGLGIRPIIRSSAPHLPFAGQTQFSLEFTLQL
ncbi:hypothetical protein ABIA39_001121 [Nocardia sp. GAS34]|uniref:hypothetical protein n=1 Tax=unclassified Nocardia TaxID=2637762 RepID=UPI003D24EA26